MKKIYSILTALCLIVFSSCDLDLQQDPNNVSPETADLNLVLNRVQVDFALFFNQSGDAGMRLTRMFNQNWNIYDQAYIPVTRDGLWTNAYASILNNIQVIMSRAEESGQRRHMGMARVMRAYTLMTLVDNFNDIPYSQALQPLVTFNPGYDPGAAVYAAALADLELAKEDFTATTAGAAPNDFLYRSNWENWGKLVNSLMLKYHLNLKLVDPAASTSAINALIAENNFIETGQEFVFRYGTNLSDPDSRHPRFQEHYTPAGASVNYHSTWFMWRMTEEKNVTDPRARYYFYRQVLVNPTDADALRCLGEIAPGHYLAGGWPFCLPGTRGYWGRDHLNNEGIPPDGLGRTVWGIYPAGGRFDNNAGVGVGPLVGAQGEGIQPIMLPAFVDFMLAEAVQTMEGVNGDAKMYLENGITKSMNYVRAFSTSTSQAAVINTFQAAAEFNEAVATYVGSVSNEWNGAPAARRMNIIGREYWLALFGNGNEAYNLYRRTGQPDNMQPGLLQNFGEFPRTMFYPNNHVVTNNQSAQRENRMGRVFWDTNPEGNNWVY